MLYCNINILLVTWIPDRQLIINAIKQQESNTEQATSANDKLIINSQLFVVYFAQNTDSHAQCCWLAHQTTLHFSPPKMMIIAIVKLILIIFMDGLTYF